METNSPERNLEAVARELLTLQRISNTMISTSFLDDVLKSIIEGLEKGLNYDAGILFIKDHAEKTLYPHLINRNRFIQEVESMLKCSFSSLSFSLEDKQNALSRSVQRRSILTTDLLDEVLFGAPVNIPPNIGQAILEKTGVKKFIAIPMVIRDEVGGVFLCATSRSRISGPELESLKNFANHAGLALDNAQIMNNLKSTQRELSEKNERLNRAYETLRELEKLKEGLVGMVVHDMKNPLTSVRGYMELILETTQEKPENMALINYIKKAYEGSEELLKMIHNLLDISRMEDGKFVLNRTMTNIPELVTSVYQQQEIVARTNERTLLLEPFPEMPALLIDYDILQRVMANLISNAIKHTAKKGTIRIISHFEPKTGVTLCVEDDGEGIPEEYLEFIFQKFSQVKGKRYRNTHNVGLGLTFCKMAIENHQGRIWVESEVNKGSKFFVWLPLKGE